MTDSIQFYMFAGAILFALGLLGLFSCRHLLRQIIAINIMGAGVFLLLIAAAERNGGAEADPVPHAMVLTGVVVAISSAALALALAARLRQATGKAELPAGDEPD